MLDIPGLIGGTLPAFINRERGLTRRAQYTHNSLSSVGSQDAITNHRPAPSDIFLSPTKLWRTCRKKRWPANEKN